MCIWINVIIDQDPVKSTLKHAEREFNVKHEKYNPVLTNTH